MYAEYFGFDSKPFKPNHPNSFYRNATIDAAVVDILGGIRKRRGLILLTGEAGLGKTLLLRRCMAEADDVRFMLLGNAHLDFPDILTYLCGDLGLEVGDLDFERQSRLLLDAYASRDRTVALLVDDAHHLRASALRRLWDFVEASAVNPEQRLPVVLAGLPDIEDRLRQPELRLLQDHVRVRCRLTPLSGMETGLFIDQQLKAAGHAGGDLLSPAVVERIAPHCGRGHRAAPGRRSCSSAMVAGNPGQWLDVGGNNGGNHYLALAVRASPGPHAATFPRLGPAGASG
jgi:general secretion pathway protein A